MIVIQVQLMPDQMQELACLIAKQIPIINKPKEQQETYSVKEVASILKVNESTIRGYLHKGKLQYTQTGKKYLIHKSSLDEYLLRNGQ